VGESIEFVGHGRKRHVHTMDCFTSYNVPHGELPERTADEMSQLKPGPAVPLRYSFCDWVEKRAATWQEMRALMVSRACGKGIEIGAGPFPLALPVECDIVYVDKFATAEQVGRIWPVSVESSVLPTDRRDSFEALGTFADASLSFVAASHVIEHTVSPVEAIVAANRKLREGGYLFLVVPDKRYTFDAPRTLTHIDHLLADYFDPSRERDFEHFLDYYEKVIGGDDWKRAAEREFQTGMDLHYHVWTITSFYEFIGRLQAEGVTRWREIWWQPAVRTGDSSGIEFYFALQK
jgi:SAM-dependent methyltransferase